MYRVSILIWCGILLLGPWFELFHGPLLGAWAIDDENKDIYEIMSDIGMSSLSTDGDSYPSYNPDDIDRSFSPLGVGPGPGPPPGNLTGPPMGNFSLNTSTMFAIYDIRVDPYESNNLYNVSEYMDQYFDLFEERRLYWTNKTINDTSPDSTMKNKGFGICGYVCPWLSSDFVPRTIEQRYSYKDAPNIVFVLIDDWGYNDFGKKSTYMSWATPTIDRLADEGITLNNYYTNELCAPSRGSLMTGRYNLRLGIFLNSAELPLSEVTMAEELQSAGYRSYIVGKWHLGISTINHLPIQRGFDYFYGYALGDNHYWSKKYGRHLDLLENNKVVTNKYERDINLHAGYLYQTKAEEIIKYHAKNHHNTPMFLYYSMQLVHSPWTAPIEYLQRCIERDDGAYDIYDDDNDRTSDMLKENYCAMNVMADEAIANLTCALNKYGFGSNTILIISGDNGGESHMTGSCYPFRGSKGSIMRGGISNHAIIHSSLIPEERKGESYDFDVHITDWLPTFMNLATNGTWKGGYTGKEIDGRNIWESILSNEESPRDETVFYSDGKSFGFQMDGIKYIYDIVNEAGSIPTRVFTKDYSPESRRTTCDNPSFFDKSWHQSARSWMVYQTAYFILVVALIILLKIVLAGTGISLLFPKTYQAIGDVDENDSVNKVMRKTDGNAFESRPLLVGSATAV